LNIRKGYIICSVRRKLKKQYAHLKGSQIVKLKRSGSEITDTILYPEVAFTRDTTSDFILDPRKCGCPERKGSYNQGIDFSVVVFRVYFS